MRITISELELSISEPILDELTPWEMKNLKGGYMTRRQRRNASTTTSSTTDFSTLLKEVDSSLEKWKTSLKDTTDSLRTQFDF